MQKTFKELSPEKQAVVEAMVEEGESTSDILNAMSGELSRASLGQVVRRLKSEKVAQSQGIPHHHKFMTREKGPEKQAENGHIDWRKVVDELKEEEARLKERLEAIRDAIQGVRKLFFADEVDVEADEDKTELPESLR